MIIRFQMWLYIYLLKKKFYKDGVWDISDEFIKTIVSKFNSNWLKTIDGKTFHEVSVDMHWKKLFSLTGILETAITNISKETQIQLFTGDYTNIKTNYLLFDYLVDTKNIPIDIIIIESYLKSLVIKLVNELQKIKITNELQYGYYKRILERPISDILELYWAFYDVSKKSNMK